MASSQSRVLEFLRLIHDLEIPYMVGGSFASSAWGQPRQTHDLDIAVQIREPDVELLYQLVKDDYICSREEMSHALTATTPFPCFQLIHTEATFKVDIFVLPPTAYSLESLARTRPFRLAADFEAPFASPEDIVITKLRWFEMGNRVSDKQWNDIVQVLETQSGQLDEAYLDRWAEHFEVKALLDKARAQVIL